PTIISNLCNKQQDEEKGFWELTEKLGPFISVLCPKLRISFEGDLKGLIDETRSSSFVGTVVIVAILTTHYQEHGAIWKTAVEKAEVYLSTTKGGSREAILNALKLFGL